MVDGQADSERNAHLATRYRGFVVGLNEYLQANDMGRKMQQPDWKEQ
jgi:hypothetical protein